MANVMLTQLKKIYPGGVIAVHESSLEIADDILVTGIVEVLPSLTVVMQPLMAPVFYCAMP